MLSDISTFRGTIFSENPEMTSREVKWRHVVRYFPNSQNMFPLMISSVCPNMNVFAWTKLKLWPFTYSLIAMQLFMKKDFSNVKTLNNYRTNGSFILKIGRSNNNHVGVLITGNYFHCEKYLINYSWKKTIEKWKHWITSELLVRLSYKLAWTLITI